MNKDKDLTIDELFKLAVKNHQEDKLDVAQDLYNKVIKVNPKKISAHNNLGLIFQKLSDYSKAKYYFEKTIEINSNYSNGYFNLGNIYKILAEPQKAISFYEKAIEIDPAHINTLNNLGLIFAELGESQKAIKYHEKIITIDPNHTDAHLSLGLNFFNLGDNQKAKYYYEKVIEIDPNYADAHNNLGVIFKDSKDYQEALSCYEKVIKINPNHIDAHYNFGAVFQELGDHKKAIYYYQKSIILKPDQNPSTYNLAVALHSNKEYKKAAEQFKLINFKNSKSFLLSCLYKLDDKSIFIKELDNQIKQGETNAIIGSLTSRSKIKYGIKRLNPFCGDPLKYTLKTDLTERYDFKNIFAKPIKDALKEGVFSSREQGLLTNGHQTAGNLFTEKNEFLKKIKETIHLEVDKYHEYFKESKEGLIKSWPKSYNINAWLVNMKSGGKLSPHMHDFGWLSGSIYINVPPKLKTDSGNLVVCIDDQQTEIEKKIMDVVTGSLCLFPSSLYHYTIPFDSKENRIVLAFDVIADES